MNILFLYDTKQEDLARDYKEFLAEAYAIDATLIPLSADTGGTLESKESHYFNNCDGAVFLLTPGAIRDGKHFPSPSVSHEMGQAKIYFQDRPEKVVYLVDSECATPAIDQKSYISFNRSDHRSIVKSSALLLRNLKIGGLKTPILPAEKAPEPAPKTPEPSAEQLYATIATPLIHCVYELSKQSGGVTDILSFRKHLATGLNLDSASANFLERDTINCGLARTFASNNFLYVSLTDLGWEIARIKHLDERRRLIELQKRQAAEAAKVREAIIRKYGKKKTI